MTGRDLIIYILNNNLENEPVFKNGKLLGFKTINEVAVENGVGCETVKVWTQLDMVPHINLIAPILIPATYISPLEKKNERIK